MAKPRFRALVLCAGFGTRLRPLTWALAKPLLPLAGEAVAGHTLRHLGQAGCEAAVVNLHHRRGDIPRSFGRSYRGLPIEYSDEEEILGTYGALAPRRALLEDCDAVVLINGDSWCEWPIRKIVRQHVGRGADVTLLLLPKSPEKALGGGIAVDGRGNVLQMRDMEKRSGDITGRFIFAGLHVISPRILKRIEARSGDILESLYQPLLQEGASLQTMKLSRGRRWHDLGTPGRYHAASIDVLRRSGLGGIIDGLSGSRRSSLSTLSRVESGAKVGLSAVERGVHVGKGATVKGSVLLEGAQIGAGCRIHSSIVGPDVRLPASSEVERRMVTRLDKRHELRDDESVIGDLVYTPL
ncbi:MAG: NDP-sugar synthase [Acidobacteriota bacterium]